MSTRSGSRLFDDEIRAYIESRLRILTGVLGVLFWVLSAAFFAAMVWGGNRQPAEALRALTSRFPNSALFFMAVVTTLIYVALRSRAISSRGLAILDAALLQVLILPCLLLYTRLHTFAFSGFAFVVPFLVLFMLARAVLVPSTALRTLLLSLSAPLGVLVIQLRYGSSIALPDVPYPRSHYIDTLIQNQVCLWGAVAVALVASHVNLSLRRRNYDARRVGQYNLEDKIGAGAMGEVYRATHSLLKRRTAIKFLRPEITGQAALERFEREVRLAASLTHPNTISIYDYGFTAEGVFYYAMEMVEGATLRDVVTASGPMPAGRVIRTLAQAAGALKEAHDKGIVHRDVKPANIMLCERGGELDFVKLLDFGVARKLGVGEEVSGTVAGSLETLAPELLRGETASPSSDLYSLAVGGYFLACGRPLFDVHTARDMMHHHLNVEPVAPSRHNPEIPADLEAILLQGLSKDPKTRYSDAGVFRESLLRCGAAFDWSQDDAHRFWEGFRPAEARATAESEITASSSETRVRNGAD